MFTRTLLLFTGLVAIAAAAPDDPWKIITKVWDDCSTRPDVSSCLQGKALTFMDRAARSESISLGSSITLDRIQGADATYTREAKALSENEVEEASKTGRLQDLLWERVSRFFNTHTIRLDLPKMTPDEIKEGVQEGRGKMKKMMGSMMMMIAMKAMTLIPLALGALFLLAGKALIISKIALVLALIITLKKLLSKQDEHGGWQSSGGHGGGGWDRRSLSLESSPLAHQLAYRAYSPQ